VEGIYLRNFRVVSSVLTAPCIVPATGRVISAAGYDAEQRVFVLNADQFKPIPLEPTFEDVRSALAALWLPVSQFPYITKPFSPSELLSKVEEFLKVNPVLPATTSEGRAEVRRGQ
jgi:hypothetical protein